MNKTSTCPEGHIRPQIKWNRPERGQDRPGSTMKPVNWTTLESIETL